jgi:hypothetical protein
MSQGRTRSDRKSWATQVAVIGMAVIVFAVGFCVFDGDDHSGTQDHAAIDFCFAMLTVSVPAVPASGLPLIGLLAAYRLAGLHPFSQLVPAPPPKPLS